VIVVADAGQVFKYAGRDAAARVTNHHRIAEREPQACRRVGAGSRQAITYMGYFATMLMPSRAAVVAQCLLRSSSGSMVAMLEASSGTSGSNSTGRPDDNVQVGCRAPRNVLAPRTAVGSPPDAAPQSSPPDGGRPSGIPMDRYRTAYP
jgi:hypothetical protein